MAEPKITPVVAIDSREQVPFEFQNLRSEVVTLTTGDYSIRGLEHLIAVERKSLPDLLACCSHGRDRFKRELQRLQAYRFRLLVVETDARTLETGDWRSQLKPNHVLGNLAAWCCQYSLPVWLGDDHAAAGRFVEKYLYQCARVVARELQAASALTGAAV